ncbi:MULTISPECIES: WYL domain-containing protein [unclassified Thermosipho (in: thermotogales)]|uniref:helix-turn-helix transcriptional regulator n=1 Tax=unclassified Thermosipho (in: thermotogales) TaxID=2676525 RepID=UPI000985B262|nr:MULTISPECIES: WYL domain-containing protein [unclassified Thermosipho (in: thermotogales)]MBT1247889.1 hypothetical protein [Thermosipho sp. 1244]OOC47412.1 hypothetical protein XO09_01525 [Thermosipho sp. 1223]
MRKKYLRILKIIIYILNQKEVTTKELSEKFNVSIRTIQRDLNEIENLGISLEREIDGTVKILENNQLHLKGLNLNLEEKKILLLMMNLSEKYLYDLFTDTINEVKIKLINSLEPQMKELNKKRSTLYRFLKQRHENIKLWIVNSIERAILEQRKIKIRYNHPKKGEEEYELSPYLFLFSKNHWYLFALESKKNFEGLFRLSRIKKVIYLNDKFKPPKDLEEKINSIWETQYSTRRYTIKIKFSKEVAQLIKDTVRHPSQIIQELENGEILYTVKVSGYKEILYWILSWGKDAELIEPKWMRKKIKEEIYKMQKKYNNNL